MSVHRCWLCQRWSPEQDGTCQACAMLAVLFCTLSLTSVLDQVIEQLISVGLL